MAVVISTAAVAALLVNYGIIQRVIDAIVVWLVEKALDAGYHRLTEAAKNFILRKAEARCPNCNEYFSGAHGVSIHYGRMHR